MRYAVALSLMVGFSLGFSWAATARAQEGDGAQASLSSWSDFTAQSAALENTSTQDCATACKALESLARAAQHICDVSPEHCEEAKTRLRTASDRVHAACPQCSVAAHTTNNPPPVTMGAGAGQQTHDVSAESTHGGGCAGCTVSSSSPTDAPFALALVALGALARSRKKKFRGV